MRFYTLTYLISLELSEEEIKNLREKINSLIQEEGGILDFATQQRMSVKKKLGYLIKKRGSAILDQVNFQLNPEKLGNFEKKLKENSQILRYLILANKLPKAILTSEKPLVRPKREIEKPKAKVELKEIEKKLEEILGE